MTLCAHALSPVFPESKQLKSRCPVQNPIIRLIAVVELGVACTLDQACLANYSHCGSSGKCECQAAYYDNDDTNNVGGTCLPSKIRCNLFLTDEILLKLIWQKIWNDQIFDAICMYLMILVVIQQ
ncbi:hypothetical protein DPMN_027177 [Dreissena polymorpha]|uniref:EB domain-containing protein n=1 Tax=Dreissena polymorpha TaxID=45954 RepID=A0A9D4LUS4_DREPO|nr:hypothetical protein DPMN_027177 [Dreissena polymorpha]